MSRTLIHPGWLLLGLWACGPEVTPEAQGGAAGLAPAPELDVDFSGCTEMAGIGLVPAANARPLVPADFTLAGDASNAVIVVRVASCAGISIDGGPSHAGTVAQIGLTTVGPDPAADINNYTLWYHVDRGQLFGRLNAMGVDARHVPGLQYSFTPGGQGGGALHVDSQPQRNPSFTADGPVVVPTAAPVQFIANWWQRGPRGLVRMHTVLPQIRFSSAQMVVHTPAGSELAALIGGTSLSFALLDSYNAFDAAHMEVRVVQ